MYSRLILTTNLDGDRLNYDPDALGEYVVGFIDILGFGAEINKISNDRYRESIAKKIGRLLYLLKHSPQIKNFENLGIQILVVSDSIIISKNFTSQMIDASFYVLRTVDLIQKILIMNNWLSRGYISSGYCYHKDGVVFGPAYIEAYNNERRHSEPKVVVEHSIATDFLHFQSSYTNADKVTLINIDNGPYYIDYLDGLASFVTEQNKDPFDYFKNLVAWSKNQTEEHAQESGVSEKYIWFTRYAEGNLSQLK